MSSFSGLSKLVELSIEFVFPFFGESGLDDYAVQRWRFNGAFRSSERHTAEPRMESISVVLSGWDTSTWMCLVGNKERFFECPDVGKGTVS